MRALGWSRVWLFSAMGVAGALPACRASLDQGRPRLDAGLAHPIGGPDAARAGADGGVLDGAAIDSVDAELRPTDAGARPTDAGARPPMDAASRPTDAGARPTDAGLPDARSADAGARADGSSGASRSTALICPGDDGAPLAPATAAPTRVPTPLPMSCNPLSRMLIIPQPSADTPGLFHRCASFSAGPVSALAVSPHGDLAAMVNSDGVARIVEIATQQVVAVLAPPRARITRVAFSSDGASLAAVAGAELEVTLYATDGWAPIWTSTLPGTPYFPGDGFFGAITFSPDGKAIAVSPGQNLYLLDAATGALRASYPSLALLDVAYAWGGRVLVAADAIPVMVGTCGEVPQAGSIVVLDPGSLAKEVVVTSWSGNNGDFTMPAFRASPTDDLVLVPPASRDQDRSIEAFRLSDGSALPRPTQPQLPIAVLPNGDLLIEDGTELEVQPASGEAISAQATAPSSVAVFAVSAPGRTVAMGGDGADLLHVWNLDQAYTLGVCTFDDPLAGPLALSGDGRLAAVASGTNIAIVSPDDGTRIQTLRAGGPYTRAELSRTGRYQASLTRSAIGPFLFGPWGGDFSDRHSSGYSAGFLFSPDENTFFNLWSPFTEGQSEMLEKLDLQTGQLTTRDVPWGTSLIGLSRGCPVLFDQLKGSAYRSCDACDEIPIPAQDESYPAVAADGTALLTNDPYPAVTATLRGLLGEIKIRTFEPPAGAGSSILASPVSVGPGGAEVLVSGRPDNPICYVGPAFADALYDSASGAVLDQLPPGGVGDDALDRIAYGTEIWCRR